MVKIGKLPRLPTIDTVSRALDELQESPGWIVGRHSEEEITEFIELVQVALSYWPEDVPKKYLVVDHACSDEDGDDYSVLRLRGGVFEAIHGSKSSDDGGEGSDVDTDWAAAVVPRDEVNEVVDSLQQHGWEMQWEMQPRAYGESDIFLHPDVKVQVAQGEFDDPYDIYVWASSQLTESYDKSGPPTLSQLADYAVMHIAESGLVPDFATWARKILRLSGKRLAPNIERELRDGVDYPWVGRELTQTLTNIWNLDNRITGSITRKNPSERLFYVDDGHTQHGPFTFAEMAKNNAEHKDLVRALRKLKEEQELHVGGGAEASFVIRCERATRDNPEHGEDGHEHSIECGEVPADDEQRINPVSEAEMQQLIDHLSSEAITEVHRCLSLFGMGGYIDDGRAQVSFSDNFVSAMGRCAYRGGGAVITLNAHAWPRVSADERLATLRHESAHAVDYLKHGSSSHGPRWKAIARKMGDDAERTHDARDMRSGRPVADVIRSDLGRTPSYRQQSVGSPPPIGGWRVGDFVEFDHNGKTLRGRIQSVNRKTVTLDNRWRVSPGLLRQAKRSNPEGDDDGVVVCEQHGWRHSPDEECAKCVEDREGPRDNPSGATSVQSLVFDCGAFSASSAKKWASGHGFLATKTDERDNTIRIRQDDPAYYADGSFRTIQLAEGVQAVIGVHQGDEQS